MLEVKNHRVTTIVLSLCAGMMAVLGAGYGSSVSYAQEVSSQSVVAQQGGSSPLTLPVNPLPNSYDLQSGYNADADLAAFLPVNPLDILKDTSTTITSSTTTTTGDRFTFSREPTTSSKKPSGSSKPSTSTSKAPMPKSQ